jgi:hypothetical protein
MFAGAGRTALHFLALLPSAAGHKPRRGGKMVSKVFSERVNIGPVTDFDLTF